MNRRSFVSSSALAISACRRAPSGRTKVRLTYPTIAVARTRGVMERTLASHGIDVEWIGPYPNHAPTLQAVATGSADFSFGGSSTPAAQAILSGSRLSFVAWSVREPRTTSIIVLPRSGIRSVADLAGKTVAVNKAGIAEFLLVAALEKYGVPRSRVNVVYLNPPDAAPAFAAGQIDAWSIWTGPLELAEVQYGAVRIFEEGKELARQIDFGSYLVRDDYARAEPDTIRKVIAAYQVEDQWTGDHPLEAQTMGAQVSRYPRPVIERIAARGYRINLRFIDDEAIAQLQSAADWLSEQKILSGRLKVDEHAVRL